MPRKKRALTRAPEHTIEILGRRYPVRDMQHASAMIERLNSQYGASEIGSQFLIREGESIIGYGSYNGKIWKGLPPDFLGRKTAKLMYDPFADDPVHYSDREYVDR